MGLDLLGLLSPGTTHGQPAQGVGAGPLGLYSQPLNWKLAEFIFSVPIELGQVCGPWPH